MRRRVTRWVGKAQRLWRRPRPGGKVFCVGCNKTGTTSVRAVLERLGYTLGDQRVAAVLAADHWPQRDFGPIAEYCATAEAFQDAPFSFPYTYQAMDAAFPGSKFILTVRDSADQWYESLIRAHGKLYAAGQVPPTRDDLQTARSWLYEGRPWEMNRLLFDTPEDEPYRRDVLIAFYEDHVGAVQEYFRHRPGDLLVLNVAEPDALGKLCRFLGKTELPGPFPHLNRT